MVTRVVAIDNIPFKEEGYLQGASSLHVKIQIPAMSHGQGINTVHNPCLGMSKLSRIFF